MDPANPLPSLHALLKARRDDLIARWSAAIATSISAASLPRAELLDRVPAFVDEMIAALYPGALPLPGTSANAFEHGAHRFRLGFDVAEVVREYGLLHECVLALAAEDQLTPAVADDMVLVRWLNAGIAAAVQEYGEQRDLELRHEASEHLGFIAHELRNPISAGLLALQRLRDTQEPARGQQRLDVLERSLRRTAELIDNALSQASLSMGLEPKLGPVGVRPLLTEIARDWEVEARARRIAIAVEVGEEDLVAQADERLLRSAVSNLLHNAIKFSHKEATVTLRGRREDGRLLIEVEDACGGLPPGKIDELFRVSVQRGHDRSGFGFGLAIVRQAVEAQHGTVRARDVAGVGCVFSVELPARTV